MTIYCETTKTLFRLEGVWGAYAAYANRGRSKHIYRFLHDCYMGTCIS